MKRMFYGKTAQTTDKIVVVTVKTVFQVKVTGSIC